MTQRLTVGLALLVVLLASAWFAPPAQDTRALCDNVDADGLRAWAWLTAEAKDTLRVVAALPDRHLHDADVEALATATQKDLVVVCSDDTSRNQGLAPLLNALEVRCTRLRETFGQTRATLATANIGPVWVRGSGRVEATSAARVLLDIDNAAVVVERQWRGHRVLVLGTPTVIDNAALFRAGNVAFALTLLNIHDVNGNTTTTCNETLGRDSARLTMLLAKGIALPLAFGLLVVLCVLSALAFLPRKNLLPDVDSTRDGGDVNARLVALEALLNHTPHANRTGEKT